MCVCARVSFVVKKAKAAPSLMAESGPLPANRGLYTFAKASRHSHPTPLLFIPSTFSHFSFKLSFLLVLWYEGQVMRSIPETVPVLQCFFYGNVFKFVWKILLVNIGHLNERWSLSVFLIRNCCQLYTDITHAITHFFLMCVNQLMLGL